MSGKYSQRDISHVNGHMVTVQRNAPIPSPSELAAYDKLSPGAASMLLNMAKNEQDAHISHVKQSDDNRRLELENQKQAIQNNKTITEKQIHAAMWLGVPVVWMAVCFAIFGAVLILLGHIKLGALIAAPVFVTVNIKFFVNLILNNLKEK